MHWLLMHIISPFMGKIQLHDQILDRIASCPCIYLLQIFLYVITYSASPIHLLLQYYCTQFTRYQFIIGYRLQAYLFLSMLSHAGEIRFFMYRFDVK